MPHFLSRLHLSLFNLSVWFAAPLLVKPVLFPSVPIPLTTPGMGLIVETKQTNKQKKTDQLLPHWFHNLPFTQLQNLPVSQHTLSLPFYYTSKPTTHFTMLSLDIRK